jgi:hypothetical protein
MQWYTCVVLVLFVAIGAMESIALWVERRSPPDRSQGETPVPRLGLRRRFWPIAVRRVTVFADPVEAESADCNREQHDQADEDEANADVPRDVGHQERGEVDEDVQQHL